jgi:hypothetical protein
MRGLRGWKALTVSPLYINRPESAPPILRRGLSSSLASLRARPARPTPAGSSRIRHVFHALLRARPLGSPYMDGLVGWDRGVAVGMHRQDYDLQLTQYDDRGWRATFYTTGMEHSPTSAMGSAWEPTPWRAVQTAALDALKRIA